MPKPALHAAVQTPNPDCDKIRKIIAKGVSMNERDKSGMCALHWAARYATTPDACLLLIQNKANVNERDIDGGTPLHWAARYSVSVSVPLLLIQNSAQIDVQDNTGDTPLHDACCFGNTQAVALLLKHGARTDIKRNDGKTPIDRAREVESWQPDQIQKAKMECVHLIAAVYHFLPNYQ
eukprot:TRINITY_DN7752_c0_g1_i1.p2 TRINITY_DN7752_c0_g1~~TRINITY_DN7752_c0_g1_i1.p2  ORF type:complete len:179 (-),score=37.21 TRINITY_DN7752_c0_g1_i1:288-824(-)